MISCNFAFSCHEQLLGVVDDDDVDTTGAWSCCFCLFVLPPLVEFDNL